MPPASRSATRVVRIESSSVVLPWSTWPITVTTGARVIESFASAASAATSSSSSSKLRDSTSAPNWRASSRAVSMSTGELMVIIIRRSSSTFSTSLTRTSSLSDRSLTVMPSASVMVRVIGGGATGAAGIGARGRCRAGSRAGGRRPEAARTRAHRRPRWRHPGRCGYTPGRGGDRLARTHRLRRQRARAAQRRGRGP